VSTEELSLEMGNGSPGKLKIAVGRWECDVGKDMRCYANRKAILCALLPFSFALIFPAGDDTK
jgi:hypothetical protein